MEKVESLATALLNKAEGEFLDRKGKHAYPSKYAAVACIEPWRLSKETLYLSVGLLILYKAKTAVNKLITVSFIFEDAFIYNNYWLKHISINALPCSDVKGIRTFEPST